MTEEEKLKLALSYAADARKSEIALLWSRSLYFWGFIAVALGSYGAAVNSKSYTYAFIASCVGIILSLTWTLANRSGKYWQAVWEWTADKYSESLFDNQLFSAYHTASVNTEKWWGPKRYSPSKLAMAVSDMIVVAWLLMAVAALGQEEQRDHVVLDLIVGTATILYAAHILRACRSGEPPTWTQVWSAAKAKFSAWRNKSKYDY